MNPTICGRDNILWPNEIYLRNGNQSMWFNILTKKENYMVCLKGFRKSLWHSFLMKIHIQLGIKGINLFWQCVPMKTTFNTILNCEKQCLPLRSGTTQGCPLSLLPFSIVLEVLNRYNKTGKRNERHPDWKERSKTLFICRHCGHLYRKFYGLFKKSY